MCSLKAFERLRHNIKKVFPQILWQKQVKLVQNWAPLATAFNFPKQAVSSPPTTGLFDLPNLKDSSGFELMKREALKDGEELVKKALRYASKPELVDIFDELSDVLCRAADLSEFVRMSHPDKTFAKAAEETSLGISAFVEVLNTDQSLYNAMKSLLGNHADMDEDARKVAELFLFDFELSGIHLDQETRKTFVSLQEKALILGSYFTHGASSPTLIPKKDCPQSIVNSFQGSGDYVAIDTMYLESPNEDLRSMAFKANLYPVESQVQCLDNLLSIRNDLANLVDFPTFAHRALKGTMAKTPENVMDFLKLLSKMLQKSAEKELTILTRLKQVATGDKNSQIMPWDLQYFVSASKTNSLKLNSSSLSGYFPLGSCMEGLSHLFQCLYGITLDPIDALPGELWSPEVQKLGVVHEKEGLLGYIYCDFLVRENKIYQDSHFTIRGGRKCADGSYQLPIVAVICNFPAPTSSSPSLLTHPMVENLFHEMGHAMHSMLARTKYQHVTGTRCATDFAEVPSVLMESFVWDSRVLSKFARHYKTGQSLPEEMIDKLCTSRNMFGAIEMQRQVLYSIVDQVYHGQHPLKKTTTEILADLQQEYTLIPHINGTAWQQRFSHLNSYGARYYSYLWSRAVASRIWHQCFSADPFNREMGERYRHTMLAHGGSKDPNRLVADMLGRELTVGDMVESLADELKSANVFY